MLMAKLKVACCAVVALFGIGALSSRDVSPSINGPPTNTASATANEPRAINPQSNFSEYRPQDKPTPEAKKSIEAEKLYSIEFREAPWSKVIEWFTGASGIPFTFINKLHGTFSFSPPLVDGKPRQYALAEIVEIINEGLKRKGYALIVTAESFSIVGEDEARRLLSEELIRVLARAKAASEEARAAEKDRDLLKKELDQLRKELQRLKELQKK